MLEASGSGCIEQRHLAGNVENAQLSTAAHRRGVEAKGLSFSKIIDVDHADDILKAESFLKS